MRRADRMCKYAWLQICLRMKFCTHVFVYVVALLCAIINERECQVKNQTCTSPEYILNMKGDWIFHSHLPCSFLFRY